MRLGHILTLALHQQHRVLPLVSELVLWAILGGVRALIDNSLIPWFVVWSRRVRQVLESHCVAGLAYSVDASQFASHTEVLTVDARTIGIFVELMLRFCVFWTTFCVPGERCISFFDLCKVVGRNILISGHALAQVLVWFASHGLTSQKAWVYSAEIVDYLQFLELLRTIFKVSRASRWSLNDGIA